MQKSFGVYWGLVFSGLMLIGLDARPVLAERLDPPKKQKYTLSFFQSAGNAAPSCQEAAQLAGQRLTQLVRGVELTGAVCEGALHYFADGKAYLHYAIQLNYRAEFPVILTQAALGKGIGSDQGAAGNSIGAYSTYSECISDLSRQTALFEKHSGASVLTSICEASVLAEEGYGYVAKFSTPEGRHRFKEQLYYLSLDQYSPESDELFERQVLGLLMGTGATLVHRNGRDLFFYAKGEYRQNRIAFFSNEAQCLSQIGDAQAIYSRSGSQRVVAACLKASWLESKTLHVLQIVGTPGALVVSDVANRSFFYADFDECIMDKPRIVESRKSAGRRPVVGVVCHEHRLGEPGFVADVWTNEGI